MTKRAENAKDKRIEKARQEIEKARNYWQRGSISRAEFILFVADKIAHERNRDAKYSLSCEIDV